MACQFPGKPGGFGGASAGRLRRASEYSLASDSEALPVAGSRRRILIPSQKLPNPSQMRPLPSSTTFGSIALKSSSVRERSTRPRSSTGISRREDQASCLWLRQCRKYFCRIASRHNRGGTHQQKTRCPAPTGSLCQGFLARSSWVCGQKRCRTVSTRADPASSGRESLHLPSARWWC